MLQINKHDQSKQRPIQRYHPKLVTNIVRKNQFSLSNKNYTFKADFIERQYLIHRDANRTRSFFGQNQETKKINKIYFKLFKDFN